MARLPHFFVSFSQGVEWRIGSFVGTRPTSLPTEVTELLAVSRRRDRDGVYASTELKQGAMCAAAIAQSFHTGALAETIQG